MHFGRVQDAGGPPDGIWEKKREVFFEQVLCHFLLNGRKKERRKVAALQQQELAPRISSHVRTRNLSPTQPYLLQAPLACRGRETMSAPSQAELFKAALSRVSPTDINGDGQPSAFSQFIENIFSRVGSGETLAVLAEEIRAGKRDYPKELSVFCRLFDKIAGGGGRLLAADHQGQHRMT